VKFRKLLRHPVGLTGFILVSLIVLLTLVGRFFIYDKSPDANTMHLSIANKSPLFTCELLDLEYRDGTSEHIAVKKTEETSSSITATMYTDPGDTTSITRTIEKNVLASYKTSSHSFPLGTDRFGRDFLSRMILGARFTLIIGLLSVLISLLIGVAIGALAGYYGGWVDTVLSWFMNVVWSLPTLLLVIALSLALGKGFSQVFIAIGLTMWVDVARIIRGQVMSLKEKEFVVAARVLGFNNFRILFRHILPNCTSSLIVITASNFAAAILLEAGLSFLGFGIQPPTPSWGMMIKEHYSFLILHIPHLALIPGIAIALLVLGVNLIGIGLRDVMDVREG
jgi:ABC-type dipeptide/oligopeptide/nickel transport system permease subunit